MKPSLHVAVSISLGAIIWFLYKSFLAVGLCLFSGVLIDIDHAIEFLLSHGLKGFSIKNVFIASKNADKPGAPYRFKKLHLVFHSLEAAFVLVVISILTNNMYLISFTIGYAAHLGMDIGANPFNPIYYFTIARARRNFDIDKVIGIRNPEKRKEE